MEFNDEQNMAINWFKGPLLVLGTPGSGKTTVILQRVKKLVQERGIDPNRILVITFTKAAAMSMEERFRRQVQEESGVRFSTFHAFFYWVVRTAYRLSPDAVLQEDERLQWIRQILFRISPEYAGNEETLTGVLRQLDRITNDMVAIEDYYSRDMPAEEFRRLYHDFQERKRRENRIDFNDMQEMCYELLKERPDILKNIRSLYPFVLVDEYQDTNRIQYEILKLLVHPADNLFAVGDDDQSVYGFRGARPEIMLNFRKEFSGGKMITLGINYRCPSVVTEQSSLLIGHNRNRYDKSLRAKRKTGPEDFIRVIPVVDDREENRMIAERIRNAVREGIPYSEMAVLYRTNENPRQLSLLLRSLGIPYTMRDTLPNLFRHMAVSPVMDYLYFAMGDRTRTRFLRIMNKPVRYIRRDMLRSENVDLSELIGGCKKEGYLVRNLIVLRNDLERIRNLPPAVAIGFIRKAVGVENAMLEIAKERNMDPEEVTERLNELASMAEPYQKIEEFLRYAEAYEELLKEENRKRSSPGRVEERGVQLMTLHSSKGLEFEEVHILNCVDGVIPHRKSKTPASAEEERRLFYVGMTRTIHRLFLYVPSMIGGKAVEPSPFIKEIREENHEWKMTGGTRTGK